MTPRGAVRESFLATNQRAAARILILDDQPEVAEMMAELVRLLGHEVIAENDPQHALERIEDDHFDLILSDFRMPEMNGQEFYLAATRRNPRLTDRFIFLTGDLRCDDLQDFLRCTGATSLAKPFNLAKVQKSISAMLAAG